MSNLLAAVRSQPWAILPGYLAAIEAMALRLQHDPALALVAEDGHQERYAAFHAAAGLRVQGTRNAVFAADGLAMVPVFGPIFPRANLITEASGAASAEQLGADLAALDASNDVRRVLLVMDTPGGAVTGISRLAAQIAAMQTPLAVHVEGICASAGYWLASQAKEISIDPTGAVGSIGVIFSTSRQEAPDANGNRSVEIVSSNAPAKRPDTTTEEGMASLRSLVDDLEAVFIADVARGRGVSEATVKADFGAGGMKSGQQAKAAGMADRVEYRGDAITRLTSKLPQKKPMRSIAEAQQAVAQLRARSNP